MHTRDYTFDCVYEYMRKWMCVGVRMRMHDFDICMFIVNEYSYKCYWWTWLYIKLINSHRRYQFTVHFLILKFIRHLYYFSYIFQYILHKTWSIWYILYNIYVNVTVEQGLLLMIYFGYMRLWYLVESECYI